jgi:hypothetical protein
VLPEIVESYRVERENRPPLPGLVLLPRPDAERIVRLAGSYVQLEAEELGAISGCLFLLRGVEMDPTWAVCDLEVKWECSKPGPVEDISTPNT